MRDPRVSVIVPCYNAAAYLREALASVLAQTHAPWEVIVVDDGSSDGSGAIAASFGPPLRCHRQDNQGIAAARNQDLRLAGGDLITFLDADDVWPWDSLACRLRHLADNPGLDLVFGREEAFTSPEPAVAEPGSPGPQPDLLAGASLFQRQAFERVGMFDQTFTVGETLDWFARAEEQGLSMAPVDALVLCRRIHGANTMRRTQRMQADYLRLLRASLARRRGTESAS
jgi:cellulose synthase/poly-beta-1,6-N-acetylglucosamine synthase-like glycosyltransferase